MKWLLRISNTHRKASMKELETLLHPTEINWINPLLGLCNTKEEIIDDIVGKSASIKWAMTNPLVLNKKQNPLKHLEKANLINLDAADDTTFSFAVRCKQLLMRDPTINNQEIERKIGAKILKQKPQLSVNLDNPDRQYLIVVSNNVMVLGWIYLFTSYESIRSRSPKESPFFGGGAMKPMLSKILVNLLTPLEPVVLDPFCGHGGFLREISSTQRLAVGIEVSWKIARENKVNNYYHREGYIQVIAADALNQPFRHAAISQTVTDPPYAKQSTTKGRDRENLVKHWLHQTVEETIIMTLPSDMAINIPPQWSLEYEIHDVVHKSLTRVIRKLVKNS